jgi:enoyl-CoA hydratase/carnithine racemase
MTDAKLKCYPRRTVLKQAAAVALSASVALDKAAATGGGDNSATTIATKNGAKTMTTLTIERREHVLLLGINRPAADNRLHPTTYGLLSKAYFDYEHDPSLRAAVLFAHGDHFSKGVDVEAFAPHIATGADEANDNSSIDPVGKATPRLTKPLIAVAHGETWNLGHELCLAADIRIAAANTRFRQSENTQGRFPGGGATVRFVRDAGWGHAMRYLLTGDSWSAEEARQMRLFQDIAPSAEEALSLGIALARKIAACGPLSIKTTLASAHLVIDDNESRALSSLFAQRRFLYGTKDFQEGLAARSQNRAPTFHGD